MDRRRVVAGIIATLLVIGALVVYSLQTSTTTTALTLTVSGILTTTNLPAGIIVVSATGSQEVLCANTSYFVPDIITSTSGSSTARTYSVVNSGVTVIITETGYPQTTTLLKTYASATNVAEAVGYVVTSTSTYYGIAPSYGYSVMTCTYLP